MDLQVCIDFVKPSCKLEVMHGSRSSDYTLFVPKVRTKEFVVKKATSINVLEDEGPVFDKD